MSRSGSASFFMAPTSAAVRDVRSFITQQCARHRVAPDLCDTAVLLTSEVATNALLHGRSAAHIDVAITAAAVRVEVSDDNSRHPLLVSSDDEALDGRGMQLVDLLASSWGVKDLALGKTVWFTLCR